MLFSQSVLARIASGEVTIAFRRWQRRPPAPGSTLRTAVGVLSIDSVRVVNESDISDEDARMSGAASRAELLSSLRVEGTLLRIVLRYLGPDPRAILREKRLAGEDQSAELLERLRRLDERAPSPWTQPLLHLISRHPGLAARELTKLATMDVALLKRRVRAFKELGLTESLTVGYQLSPRGQDMLEFVRHSSGRSSPRQ